MDSLYGGKPGISFVLKASFPSVKEMVTAFKNGGNYTNVWYGEYVIIDTINKQNPDNGKVYRRGLDYQNTVGGAEYIGQIVGPSSGTPYFQINDLDNTIKEATSSVNNETSWKRYPTGLDENGRYVISEDGDGSDIGIFEFKKDESLVPGKDGTNYHDSIKYTWVNIRNDENDADSWFYVGFEIPYLVIDYKINSISPYNSNKNRVDLATITRTDDKKHPFWEEWTLGVPKGIKGDTLKNFRIITPKQSDVIYTIDAIHTTADAVTGNFHTTLDAPGYEGQQDDIDNGRKILIFDYSFYDDTLDGTTIQVYVGDYNLIEAINLDAEGTITISMTHDDDQVFEKKIRWIDNINLTTGNGLNGGHFTFEFNNDDPEKTKTFDITWIKNIEITENGSVKYTYAGDSTGLRRADAHELEEGIWQVDEFLTWVTNATLNGETGRFIITDNHGGNLLDTTLDWVKDIQLDDDGTLHLIHTVSSNNKTKQIMWIKDVTLNPLNGQFNIEFNTGDTADFQLDWINNLYVDESNGLIGIHHVDNTQNSGTVLGNPAQVLDAKLKLITSASISDTGELTFHTNTGDSFSVTALNSNQTFKIKMIKDVELATGILEDKHIKVTYNTGDSENIGNPINFIEDMVVRPEDWHLLVLFSDPDSRATANDVNDQGKDAQGNIWVNGIIGSDNRRYPNSVYWRDFGPIKDQSGILIGLNVTEEEVNNSNQDNIIDYLNEKYPTGLTGEANKVGGPSTQGKVVTYSYTNVDDKEFYAFDYGGTGWYKLGTLQDSGMRDARLGDRNSSLFPSIVSSLTTNGLFFGAEQVSYSTEAIPNYWNVSYNEWI